MQIKIYREWLKKAISNRGMKKRRNLELIVVLYQVFAEVTSEQHNLMEDPWFKNNASNRISAKYISSKTTVCALCTKGRQSLLLWKI